MAKPFPKAYVGFYYQKKGQFFCCLVPAEKAGERWENLEEEGCEVISMEDLEDDREIKSFLIRGTHYAKVWLRLASQNQKKQGEEDAKNNLQMPDL